MTNVSQAVVLMAGSGSRLRGSDETFLKPLAPMRGRPLVCYTMDALSRAGIKTIHFIVGFQRQRLVEAMKELAPPGVELRFIENPEWKKQNGISLLAARDRLTEPFLLAMCDHLFDDVMISLLIESAEPDSLNLAIDRKIASIFDLDDAMKVQTHGDRIVAIGKNLRAYDAIDTGLFVCPVQIFEYLEEARENDDCSLADGVRLMAAEGKARVVDIGDAWWQDVDTPEMFEQAEKHLAAKSALPTSAR